MHTGKFANLFFFLNAEKMIVLFNRLNLGNETRISYNKEEEKTVRRWDQFWLMHVYLGEYTW